jgi:uncharacterized protein
MRRPSHAESVRIEGPAGALETMLEEPAGGDGSSFGVICHPHPLHGGTLSNKVVFTLARALQELGVPTLRFNFRGVGASEGGFAGGAGEIEDTLAVVAWGKKRWPHATPCMLGFSFGAMVALATATRADARLLVTVAPPIARAATAPPIERAPGIEQIARASLVPRCPWLIVQGDGDEIVDARAVLDWAAERDPAPTVRVLHGASHFFHGQLPELREIVVQFAQESGVAARRA